MEKERNEYLEQILDFDAAQKLIAARPRTGMV